jgi:hypothetical protein
MKKFKVVLLMLLLLPTVSFAGGWSPFQKVHLIFINGGRIFFTFNADYKHVNPDDCAAASYFILRPDSVGFKEIYQMLLTAEAADKNFRVYLSGCDGAYPKVKDAMMY